MTIAEEPKKIRAEIQRRNITRVCHFTRLENIRSIHDHGILSTRSLDVKKRSGTINDFEQNDDQRLDEDYGISCSVQFPNIRLLRKWMDYKYSGISWVILNLNPEVLCNNGAVNKFCETNAATQRGALVQCGSQGFKSMFKDQIQTATGKLIRDSSLHSSSTTDIQAEALLYGPIEWSQIQSITTHSESDQRELQESFSDVNVIFHQESFTYSYINSGRSLF